MKYFYEVLNITPFLRINTTSLQCSASFLTQQAIRKVSVEKSRAWVEVTKLQWLNILHYLFSYTHLNRTSDIPAVFVYSSHDVHSNTYT